MIGGLWKREHEPTLKGAAEETGETGDGGADDCLWDVMTAYWLDFSRAAVFGARLPSGDVGGLRLLVS